MSLVKTTTIVCAIVLGAVWAKPTVLRADSSRESSRLFQRAEALFESGAFQEMADLLRASLDDQELRAPVAQLLRALDQVPEYELPIDREGLSDAHRQLGSGFNQTQTKHFVVLSDSGHAWTRSRSILLERTYDQYFRAADRLGIEVSPPAHKLLCVLIDEHERYTAFAKAHDGVDALWIAGYYASRSNRVVFYNDVTGPAFESATEQIEQFRQAADRAERRATAMRRARAVEGAAALVKAAQRFRGEIETQFQQIEEDAAAASVSKTTHEAAHLLAFNTGLQSRSRQYPFWLTEGFASLFEASNPDRPFGPGTGMTQRDGEMRDLLVQGGLLPLDVFVSLNHVPHEADGQAEAARAMYAQAASFFEWCYRYERQALGGYFEDLSGEPAGLISPRRHGEMFRAGFGDPASIDRQWRRDENHRLGLD